MRTIIAGSRDCTDYDLLEKAIKECGWIPTVVISGNAKGADTLGEIWAEKNDVPYELYPAKWKLYGRSAGPRRNIEMSEVAEALIALWDGESRGTKHMIDTARKKGLRCYIKLTINSPSLLDLI
jgi:hypothetical protein